MFLCVMTSVLIFPGKVDLLNKGQSRLPVSSPTWYTSLETIVLWFSSFVYFGKWIREEPYSCHFTVLSSVFYMQ